MTSQDRYGAAVHEAGHVVVAWALDVKARRMAIGINGDDAAGEADIDYNTHLPMVNQIAIFAAGADAQGMLDAPTNAIAATMDMNKIRKLVEDCPDDEGEALRYAGYRRSKELLERYRTQVERLAKALAERSELDQVAIEQLLIPNGG
jgi:ATP-dependent Zn protease